MASGSLRVDSARGATLIETMIALGLIVILVVTMAALIATGRTVIVATRTEAVALTLARARLEQLEGLAFSTYGLASGGVVEVTDLVTDLSAAEPSIGGPGLATSPENALIEPQAGYVDYLDGHGRWVGVDASAGRRASYTRRWSVRRIGSGPTEIVTFEVMVAPQAVVLRTDGATLLRQPGVVRLVGVRSRRAHRKRRRPAGPQSAGRGQEP